jgi:hypothetical protein
VAPLGADEDCADAAAHRLAITSPQINFFISVILFLRKVIFKHHNGRRGGKVHGVGKKEVRISFDIQTS